MSDKPLFVFVRSEVDDAGLDASEFRVVAHLSRRQNDKREGYAWPGKASIAKTCRLNEKTVERVLKDLLAWNVISEDRSQTHQGAGVYRRVNNPSVWQVPDRAPHPKADPGASFGGGSKEAPGGEVNGAPGGGPKRSPPKDIHTRESKKEIYSDGVFPECLNSEDFKSEFSRWIQHLKQKNHKATPIAVEEMLRKCEVIGRHRAIAMIRHSIAGNWKSLIEASPAHSSNGHPPRELKSMTGQSVAEIRKRA
jgi:hypothetical protein